VGIGSSLPLTSGTGTDLQTVENAGLDGPGVSSSSGTASTSVQDGGEVVDDTTDGQILGIRPTSLGVPRIPALQRGTETANPDADAAANAAPVDTAYSGLNLSAMHLGAARAPTQRGAWRSNLVQGGVAASHHGARSAEATDGNAIQASGCSSAGHGRQWL